MLQDARGAIGPSGLPSERAMRSLGWRQMALLAAGLFAAALLSLPRAAIAQAATPAAAQPATREALDPLEGALLRSATGQPSSPSAADAQRSLPAKLTPGEPVALNLTAANRSARVHLRSLVLRNGYGPLAARPGSALLVLDTEWQNLIPLTLVYERQVPTEYRIPALADHLYLVINGRRLARLLPGASDLPGHLPVKDFGLPRIGSRLRGNVAFEVPAEGVESLELRFYDYAHGHMTLALVAPAGPAATAAAKPLSPAQKNQVLEVAAFGLTREKRRGGRTAPEGMTFAAVDLRARSLYQIDGDASAFNPKAAKGARMKIGTVADWKESRRYLRLVADGEYDYTSEPGLTELPEEPRFLPDVMTGGTAVFLISEKATSLELRCDFPNARTSSGQQFRPAGMNVALEGRRPKLPERPAIASVDDDIFKVAVVGQSAAQEFAGQKPASGNFLVLDVTVQNVSKEGEFFQTKEQLKYADAAGNVTDLSAATFAGPRRPAPLVWIPSKEQRTFQVVYDIPTSEQRPRLSYTGLASRRCWT